MEGDGKVARVQGVDDEGSLLRDGWSLMRGSRYGGCGESKGDSESRR